MFVFKIQEEKLGYTRGLMRNVLDKVFDFLGRSFFGTEVEASKNVTISKWRTFADADAIAFYLLDIFYHNIRNRKWFILFPPFSSAVRMANLFYNRQKQEFLVHIVVWCSIRCSTGF